MFERILLPVDGSPLSELAVPMAEMLARAQNAEIVVARVVQPVAWIGYEPVGYVSAQVYQDMADALDQECSDYVAKLGERLQSSGVKTRTELLRGPTAVALLDFEVAIHPDLVVMSTHGRSGLARFALGSIADMLVREGTAPVLLVRPFSPARIRMETALVPLDGSALAERSLPTIQALAGKPLRKVRLLRAIADPSEAAGAADYLGQAGQDLRAGGLEVEVMVEIDSPATAIERAAAGMDLVVLSTHGRGGLDRLRHGSVAEQITRHLAVPTLLVRAAATEAVAPA